jgi:hypothetical protein
MKLHTLQGIHGTRDSDISLQKCYRLLEIMLPIPKFSLKNFTILNANRAISPKVPKKSQKIQQIHALTSSKKIHSDIWGPASTESPKGKRYYISFIDEKSRYAEVIFIGERSEAFSAIKEFTNRIENQTGKKITIFKSDNA